MGLFPYHTRSVLVQMQNVNSAPAPMQNEKIQRLPAQACSNPRSSRHIRGLCSNVVFILPAGFTQSFHIQPSCTGRGLKMQRFIDRAAAASGRIVTWLCEFCCRKGQSPTRFGRSNKLPTTCIFYPHHSPYSFSPARSCRPH
jgi:hypothetical protein